ncbi:MAG: Hpt domain-containing protein [Myxococcales bacterium]|nr:Hpt domain-containing protein [Myxococcales bacterium]
MTTRAALIDAARTRLRELGVDEATQPVVARALLSQVPEHVAELERAARARDLAALRRRCHKLDGAAAMFGLDEVRARCRALRASLDDPARVESALELRRGPLAALLAAVEDARRALREWVDG